MRKLTSFIAVLAPAVLTACASVPPPMESRTRTAEAPLVAPEAAAGIDRIVLLVTGASAASLQAALADMRFEYQASWVQPTARDLGGLVEVAPVCLFPIALPFCAAFIAAGAATVQGVHNAARYTEQKEQFDWARARTAVLAREDVTKQLSVAIARRSAGRTLIVETLEAEGPLSAPDNEAASIRWPEGVAAAQDRAAILLIQVHSVDAYVAETRRAFAPNLRYPTLRLNFKAELFAPVTRDRIALLARIADAYESGRADDPEAFIARHLPALIETAAAQVDESILQPIADRARLGITRDAVAP